MHFCTESATPLPDNNTICPRCGKKTAAPESKPTTPSPDNQPPTPPKTGHIHGIAGYTTSLLKGTWPIGGRKMATPGELHHLHNHYEEIPGGTKTSISRQYDEIIVSLTNDESRLQQQRDEGIAWLTAYAPLKNNQWGIPPVKMQMKKKERSLVLGTRIASQMDLRIISAGRINRRDFILPVFHLPYRN